MFLITRRSETVSQTRERLTLVLHLLVSDDASLSHLSQFVLLLRGCLAVQIYVVQAGLGDVVVAWTA
jgi:hypothetical protein